MGAIGVLVPDALDDGHITFIPQRLHRGHAGVESNFIVERQYPVLGNVHRGARIVVPAIAVGHNRVQAIVAAG